MSRQVGGVDGRQSCPWVGRGSSLCLPLNLAGNLKPLQKDKVCPNENAKGNSFVIGTPLMPTALCVFILIIKSYPVTILQTIHAGPHVSKH